MHKPQKNSPPKKPSISKIPLTPGVYFFKDNKNEIIYVGKAKALRKRIQSYFKDNIQDMKTRMLVLNTKYVDYIQVNTERVALLLEDKLIKKLKPKYNIDLRDAKTYPYLKFVKTDYPYFTITRKYKEDGSLYWGPYVDVRTLRKVYRLISRLFPLRKCKKSLIKKQKKPCLNYHLGYCLGPCTEDIDKKLYNKVVRDVKSFLSGKYKKVMAEWQREVKRLSKELKFEEAAVLANKLNMLQDVSKINVMFWQMDESALNRVLSNKNKINENIASILGLKKQIRTVAGFDISNISGKFAVGSRVVFKDGKPYKDMYRRYKIKFTEHKPNDVAMMKEVIQRCLKGQDVEDIDLFLIDGGKGQLNTAYKEIQKSKKLIPVISIAKREEHIFIPKKSKPLILNKDSNILKLFQQIRDESHRFAITYHRKLRQL